jgi:alpha-N-arabinofuranosidase
MNRSNLFALMCVLLGGTSVAAAGTDAIQLSIDAARAGARIDRNIFGQFAEHLGPAASAMTWSRR